jgi:hypothetical protein
MEIWFTNMKFYFFGLDLGRTVNVVEELIKNKQLSTISIPL